MKTRLSVIPAKAGIQSFQIVISSLESGFHRSDDFLRLHQVLYLMLVSAVSSFSAVNLAFSAATSPKQPDSIMSP